MLSEREVISTLNMLRNEHLDVRTVTLGVSLFDCVSHDLDLFTANVKAKLRRYASQLVSVCNEVGDKYGIPVVNKRISVSPIAVVGAPFGPDGMVRVCKALDEAAKEAGVDFLGGFSALVEKGFAKGDRALIEALPQALAETDRICSSINVASSRSGINMDGGPHGSTDPQGGRSHRRTRRHRLRKAGGFCQYSAGCSLHGWRLPWRGRA